MSLPIKSFVLPLALLLTSTFCVADETVFGPPEMIVDAKIQDGSRGEQRITGTILSWNVTRQNWSKELEVKQGARSVTTTFEKGRTIYLLEEKQFIATLRSVRFYRLDGEQIDSGDAASLLKNDRAVAFLPKGVAIHPKIAKSLHPDTVVVKKVSYPNDPVVIGVPD